MLVKSFLTEFSGEPKVGGSAIQPFGTMGSLCPSGLLATVSQSTNDWQW